MCTVLSRLESMLVLKRLILTGWGALETYESLSGTGTRIKVHFCVVNFSPCHSLPLNYSYHNNTTVDGIPHFSVIKQTSISVRNCIGMCVHVCMCVCVFDELFTYLGAVGPPFPVELVSPAPPGVAWSQCHCNPAPASTYHAGYLYKYIIINIIWVVSSYKESRNNKPMYGYMSPNLSPSPNLYKVQSVYNNNVAS